MWKNKQSGIQVSTYLVAQGQLSDEESVREALCRLIETLEDNGVLESAELDYVLRMGGVYTKAGETR